MSAGRQPPQGERLTRSLSWSPALPEDRCAGDVWRGARTKVAAGLALCHRPHGAWRLRREHAAAAPSEVRPNETGYPVGLNRNSSNRMGLTIPLIFQRASPGEKRIHQTNEERADGAPRPGRSPPLHQNCTILELPQSPPWVVQPRTRPFVRSIVNRGHRGSPSDAERTKARPAWLAPGALVSLFCVLCQGGRGVEGALGRRGRRLPEEGRSRTWGRARQSLIPAP